MYDVPIDLRRLRYFVVAAEELNFSRAAERLQMAQQPLSSQIKQLEKELGVRLFDRTSRGVRLTEAGQLLFEEARRIFVQIEQTASAVRRVGNGEVGQLTLGFVPSATDSVLPVLLREFRERFPGVELFLQEELNPDQVVRRLHEGRIDVGFLYLPLDDGTLSFRSVCREPLVVALPAAHPLTVEPRVAIRSLTDEPFILPARYGVPGLHGRIIEVCRQAGFSPKAVQKEVWLTQTIVGLVAGSMGVALVPASFRNLCRRGVIYKSLTDSSPEVEMGVVWRRADSSSVVQSFLGVVEGFPRRDVGEDGDTGFGYASITSAHPPVRAKRDSQY